MIPAVGSVYGCKKLPRLRFRSLSDGLGRDVPVVFGGTVGV